MKDVTYIAAYPKSGITFLNYMLYHILFDEPWQVERIDSDYIIDLHETRRFPQPNGAMRYAKTHYPFSTRLPLFDRGARAIYLVRDPIDVMMSAWDYAHLLGNATLLNASEEEHAKMFHAYKKNWIEWGGQGYPFAGSWIENVRAWLEQSVLPMLVVSYEKLVDDPRRELERILKFLDITSDRIGLAVERGSVSAMREQELKEAENGTAGAFYRPALANGYFHGYRFIGNLHRQSYDKVLSSDERRRANEIFGVTIERVARRA